MSYKTEVCNSQPAEIETSLADEITPDGRRKDDIREDIIEGYRVGAYTGEQCFNWFDEDKLWPARKSEFWAIFFDGLRASQSLADADNAQGLRHTPDNGMTASYASGGAL